MEVGGSAELWKLTQRHLVSRTRMLAAVRAACPSAACTLGAAAGSADGAGIESGSSAAARGKDGHEGSSHHERSSHYEGAALAELSSRMDALDARVGGQLGDVASEVHALAAKLDAILQRLPAVPPPPP